MLIVKELPGNHLCAMGFKHINRWGVYDNGRLVAVGRNREALEETVELRIMQPPNEGKLPQARLEGSECA